MKTSTHAAHAETHILMQKHTWVCSTVFKWPPGNTGPTYYRGQIIMCMIQAPV